MTHTDAGALLKLADDIDASHTRVQYAEILWEHAETIAATLRQAASQGNAGGERSAVQSGGVYTDQPIFDALAAATHIDKDPDGFPHIVISAQKFIETFNNHRDRALCTSLNAAQAPIISVKPMELSDDRTDYFVSISVGDREITPYVFRDEQFKAEYEVASFRWLLLGEPKPDLMAYSEDGWPSTVPSAKEHTP